MRWLALLLALSGCERQAAELAAYKVQLTGRCLATATALRLAEPRCLCNANVSTCTLAHETPMGTRTITLGCWYQDCSQE